MLEGNIGVGKSTLLKILGQKLDVDIFFEPTDKWQKVGGGGNLLDLFYKDTKRWAYTFQSYAFISRLQTMSDHERQKTGGKSIQLLERSVYCDRFCFAKNCFESGLMSELEWQIYKEWFAWLVEKYTTKPQGFIYLRTSPDVCYKRLVKRNRSEEEAISLDYLSLLHKKHEDWLVNRKEVALAVSSIPVLSVDCDKDFEHDQNRQDQIVAMIHEFITHGAYAHGQVNKQAKKRRITRSVCC